MVAPLIVTLPLPNEFSSGHLGRIIKINGGKTLKAPSLALLGHLYSQAHGDKQPSPIHALAYLAGMETAAYARSHTLLPFQSFAFEKDADGSTMNWRIAHFRRFGLSAINPRAGVCPECIRDDHERHGFSYWHREHQVVGVSLCAHHGSPLRFVPSDGILFEPPEEAISRAISIENDLGRLRSDSAVSRYHDIVQRMLNKGAPASLYRARDHIAARAKSLGLSWCKISKEERLVSDAVFRTFPRTWLTDIFPNSSTKRMGHQSGVFDNVVRKSSVNRFSAAALAVVLATLFESAEDALDTICSRHPPVLEGDTKKRRPGRPSQRAELAKTYQRKPTFSANGSARVAQAFLMHGGDVDAMARSLGCTVEQVRRRMSFHRKYVLNALRETREYEALKIFLGGLSLSETSRQFNVPIPTLEALLRLMHRKVTLEDPLPYACS